MQLIIKITISLLVILIATAISRRYPSLAGLIAVMPLTGALVLVWVYLDNQGKAETMSAFARGALWGILPSILFFLVALLCFKKQLPLAAVLGASFGAWLAGAALHQWLQR